jgi:hypothetical protein|nr:MAG TPA: hypothetical protein [Caudoviricetes sp.]
MGATVKYYNLTGGLNTVQGIGTINQSNKRTESPDMKNVEYYKLGGLKSMKGNTQFANTLPSQISLGFEYVCGNNKYMVVTTIDGTLYIYDKITNTFKEIFKFKTPTSRHSICTFNNGIVVSNGVDDLLFYQYNRHNLLSGTVTTSTENNSVTGTSTEFTTQLSVGDYIEINSVKYKVIEITSDTELRIEPTPTEAVTDSNYYLSDISELNAVYKNTDDPNISKPIRGLALQSYQGRIFVGGNDGILYYSEVGLIHGWDLKYGAGAIPSFYDDNSDFTAFGLWDKYLIICKRERSYILDGTDADTTNWTVSPYSDFTCDSQQSWLVANNSFLVYTRTGGGIYPLLQRTIYNANYQGNDLSVKIRDSFEYVNTAKFDYIFPVYAPKKKYIMFYIPMLMGVGSNYCFIFDIQSKTWLLRVVPQDVTVAFRYNNEIYIGTSDGKVLKEFSSLTFDGQPIEWYWKSPWFSYGEGSNHLSTREFRINIAEESTNRFHVRNRRDGKDAYNTRAVSNNLDSFIGLVWDVDNEENSLTDTTWDNDSWVTTSHIVKRFPLPKQYFQTTQIEFYGNAVDEGMSIYGFEIDGIQLEEVPWN